MFDSEKFIKEVEQRPPLYDLLSKGHSNRVEKAKCWNEIGDIMYDDWKYLTSEQKEKKAKELTKKWKAIRDNFVREFRTLKTTANEGLVIKKGKYVYFDHLLFLLPYLQGYENTTANSPPHTDNVSFIEQNKLTKPDRKEIDTERKVAVKIPSCDSDNVFNRKQAKRQCNKETLLGKTEVQDNLPDKFLGNVQLTEDDRNSDKYGNRAFLLSFAPLMDSLPQHLSCRARIEIAQIFNELTFNIS